MENNTHATNCRNIYEQLEDMFGDELWNGWHARSLETHDTVGWVSNGKFYEETFDERCDFFANCQPGDDFVVYYEAIHCEPFSSFLERMLTLRCEVKHNYQLRSQTAVDLLARNT